MDALREATDKLKQKRKKKSKKDKMRNHVPGTKWTLVDDTEASEISLTDLSYTVGRESADIIIQDKSVSQIHAFLNFSEELCCFQVTDLNTDTGTYVNASRIPAQLPVTLQPKDRLQFGNSCKTLLVTNMSSETIERKQEQAEVTTVHHRHDPHHPSLLDKNSGTDTVRKDASMHEPVTSPSPSKAAAVQQISSVLHSKRLMRQGSAGSGSSTGNREVYAEGDKSSLHNLLSKVTTTGANASTAAKSPTVRRLRPKNTATNQTEDARAGNTLHSKQDPTMDGNFGGISEKKHQESLPVWAKRHETCHTMAECPGCIAEQEIHHTCGSPDEDGSLPPHSSIAHTHPETTHHHPSPHLPPAHAQQSWEEPPSPRYHHHPAAYPPHPIDYRTYSTASSSTSQRTEFTGDNFLFSPASHGYSPTTPRYPGERRSHEASESQLKRSKSAQFQYETQGFVPYGSLSRDPYHYPYPSGGQYPSHSYHPAAPPPPPHLHGYYPPQTAASQHHPMYAHYPSKAMYHGCKTCNSFMAEYGQVPGEHLHYHAIAGGSGPATQPDMISPPHEDQAAFPPPALPRQPPPATVPLGSDVTQDASPSDQGYGSQTEKIESLESSTISTSDKFEETASDKIMESKEGTCDVLEGNGTNYVSTLSATVTSVMNTEGGNKASQFGTEDGSPCKDNGDVDFIPERDYNNGGQVIQSQGVESQGSLRTDSPSEGGTGEKSELYGQPAWWGDTKNMHDMSGEVDTSLNESVPVEVTGLLSSDPTHTPPERDTGPNGLATSDCHGLATTETRQAPELVTQHQQRVVHATERATGAEPMDISQSCAEEPASVTMNETSETRPTPQKSVVKSASIDVAQAVQYTDHFQDKCKQEETTSIQTHKMSSSTPQTAAQLTESADAPSTQVEDSSSSNHQSSETVNQSTKASEAAVPVNKATDSVIPPKRGSSMAFTIDLGNDSPQPPPPSKPTAFTVDMGSDEPVVTSNNKKLTHIDSLSNFLPQKLRKSFKDRASKVKSEKEDKEKNEASGQESETHVYTSPLSKRRSVATTGLKSGRQRTGYHSDGTHSAMSSDNEEYSIHSDRTAAARKSLPPRPAATPQRPRHRPKPESSHARSSRVLEGMSVEKKIEQRMLRSKSAGFSKANSIDDYLNSMGQCDDRESVPPVTATGQNGDENHPLPEYVLYKEAKHYDSIIQSKSTSKRKEDGGKKPRVNTNSRSLNVPRTTDEDNLSETGTYTIENDKDVQSARLSIDTVFNVPDRLENLRMRTNGYPVRPQPKKPFVGNAGGRHGKQFSDGDINGNFQQLEAAERARARVSDGMHTEVSSSQSSLREVATEHPAQEKSSFYVTAMAPNSSMFTQLKTDSYMELTKSPELQPPHTSISSTSPHSQGGRRTRRKLPTPPVKQGSDSASPRTPRTATTASELDIDSPGRHRGSVTYNNDDGGSSFTVSFDAPQKQEAAITERDNESTVSSMFTQSHGTVTNECNVMDSARSIGSLDTEVLLKDTEHVMQVLEKQVGKRRFMRKDSLDDEEFDSSQYSPVPKEDLCINLDRDSDSDASSTNAVVEESVPRFAKDNTPEASHKPHKTRDSYKGKPFSIKDRALGLKGKTSKRLSSSSADFDRYGGTDDSENETSSFASTGTNYSNMAAQSTSSPKFQRQGSSGKGNIANTRTNRTFALRRGVADGSDSESARTESARSARTEKSTPRTRSRPSSAKESNRTDASLGTKIVQKSRDNIKASSGKDRKDTSLTRKDGGRFSLRGSKSTAVSSVPKTSDSSKTAKKKPDLVTPRSGRLSTGSLSVSGNTPKATSQPSKSKKADEYQAWQRRNKYDPRKAVADAKAKEKRTRSVGNTPEFTDSLPRGETIDSVSSEELHIDEITKLSSAVANDLNLMTSQVAQESDIYTEEYTEVRSSAFKSVTSSGHTTNGSAFKSPVKNTASPLYSPVPIKSQTISTQYDPVLVSSIQQVSCGLKSQVHRIMDRLSEERGVESVAVEDLLSQSLEDASPELSATLANLRNTEMLLKILERELFSESEEVSLQESNRIRDEAGFRPIPQPVHSREPAKTKKPAASSKKSSRVTRVSHTQESRVTYPSAEYY